jgi:50S ribosomal protein L16 3-hydroxylase
MTMFSSISKEDFLANIWQKKTYIFRDAKNDIVDLVDGNELAGLACEEEVESRIISGYDALGEWSCRQGPFDTSYFSQLPEKNWTLLVQGMDQWIDEVRDILADFTFLPQWRLEDVMASYAPVGGGVGPHFDYYDVFLIQVSGSREWRLGQMCDETTALQDHASVKLLANFETAETHQIHAGDILYIPAGKAHWGVASSDDCITFSVGFRAPSEKELLSSLLENMINEFSDHRRYQDNLASIDEHPAKINAAVHQQLTDFLHNLSTEKLQRAAEQAFGELVTEPRYSAFDEPLVIEKNALKNAIDECIAMQEDLELYIPPHTRLAFSETHLFVNGDTYCIDPVLAKAICEGVIPSQQLRDMPIDMLYTLLHRGDITLLME